MLIPVRNKETGKIEMVTIDNPYVQKMPQFNAIREKEEDKPVVDTTGLPKKLEKDINLGVIERVKSPEILQAQGTFGVTTKKKEK